MSRAWLRAAGVVGSLSGTVALAVRHRKVARERAVTAIGASLEPAELGVLPPGRESSVAADDGLRLAVEEIPPAGGPPELTAVLVHGFALDRRSWHFQRRMLATLAEPPTRTVLYDHRSHGRSGRAGKDACSIEMLAADLAAVVRAAAPEGPLVLVGHSMGGMTIMGLAELDPGLFAERVAGVALLSTSAGDVARHGLPRAVLSHRNPVLALLGWLADAYPGLVTGARRIGTDLTWTMVKAYSYGDRAVRPALVDLIASMIDAAPVEVLVNFAPALSSHDRVAALPALSTCEVLVVSGDADRLIPFSHSEVIAAELPGARLVRVAGAGHAVILERPEVVNDALVELLDRVAGRVADRGRGRRGWTRGV